MRGWFAVVAVVALVAASCKGSNDHPAVDGGGDLGGGPGSGGTGGTGGSGGPAGADGAIDRAPADATHDGGGTGGSDGTGGADGSSGSDGGDGGTIRHCGGIAGLTCSALEWCDFPGDTCGSGDQQGDCTPRDRSLTDCGGVVCGCDGKTYPNACDAHLHGVDTTSTKGCIRGNGAVGAPCGQDGDCQSGLRCCRSGGPVGTPLACTATGGAGCPALP